MLKYVFKLSFIQVGLKLDHFTDQVSIHVRNPSIHHLQLLGGCKTGNLEKEGVYVPGSSLQFRQSVNYLVYVNSP